MGRSGVEAQADLAARLRVVAAFDEGLADGEFGVGSGSSEVARVNDDGVYAVGVPMLDDLAVGERQGARQLVAMGKESGDQVDHWQPDSLIHEESS